MAKAFGVTRRGFVCTSVGGAAAVTGGFVPSFAWTAKAFANESANDRPRIGCIGVGSMGTGDAKAHAKFGDILAVCDVDSRHADRARNDAGIGKGKADTYGDYRRVLERPDIDVVSIVTTDPWHVKIAVEALQAGKHVFCQKPLSLTLEENQLSRAAAEKYPKLQFFIGTQQRSQKDQFLRAVNLVHKGLLGKISKVTVGINGSPKGGPFPVETPPKELDWNMWLGQAPMVDYRAKRCHYEYRWWYEYSGGKFTDWGAHHVDIAQWALNEDTQGRGPTKIDGTDAHHPVPFKDGYPTVDDSYNTAHDFAVKCTFPSGVEMVIDSRSDNGVLFEGEKGRVYVNRSKITGKPIEEQWDKDQFGDADVMALYKGKPFEGHKENFYRCIREGGLPVSDVFSHIMAMNTCHLAAIAARLGRAITWDPAAEKIVGDDQAAAFASRTPRAGFELPKV
jgi:predicted dehydrogenase